MKQYGQAFWAMLSVLAVANSGDAYAVQGAGDTTDAKAAPTPAMRAQADKDCALLAAHVSNGEKVAVKNLYTGQMGSSPAVANLVSSCAKFSAMCPQTVQKLAEYKVTLSDLQCKIAAKQQVAGLCVEDWTMAMGHPDWLKLGPQYRCVGKGWVRGPAISNERQCQIDCVGGPAN